METIKYESENGYMGILYGKRSLAIYDKTGHEVFHTGFRTINTYEQLKKQVDEFPKFYAMLHAITASDEIDDDI